MYRVSLAKSHFVYVGGKALLALSIFTLLFFASFHAAHAQDANQIFIPFVEQAELERPIPGVRGAPQSCMDDLVAGRLNCTANDVGVARFSVLNGITECFEGEDIDVNLQAEMVSTSALRYDVGFFVANDGGNALTGQCVRDFLTPSPLPINAPYNPTSGFGPYLNADGNACGDIRQDQPTFKRINVVTIKCEDENNDEILDVGTCASWENSVSSCSNIDDTLPSTPSKCKCGNVPVGQVIVRKVAYLEVIKDVVPDDAPGRFNLLVDGVAEATAVGNLGTTGVMTVAAGTNRTPGATHTVGEAASGTTNLADYSIAISCVTRGTNNVVAVANGAGPVNVPVNPGDNIVCTVTNRYNKATLEIVKNVVPNDPATNWNFDVAGPTSLPPTTIAGDGSTGARTVLAGNYTIAESAGAGTDASDYVTTWSCTDGAARGRFLRTGRTTSLQVTILPNQHIVCTFTNTRTTGTILVSKLTTGGDGVFTMEAGPPPLPSAFNLSTTNGEAQTSFVNVPTGQYTITESDIPPGWVLDDVQCSETGSVDSGVVGSTANISLQPDEVVECTFRNVQLGELRVTKVVNWNGFTPDNTQQFEICIQGPSYPIGTEPDACQTADFDGGELVWSNLLPGSYHVNETTPAGGWTVSGTPVDVAVAGGQTATTEVVNTRLPLDLFISKGGSSLYTRSYNWTLDKQVEPAVHDMFFGDTAQVTYTVAAIRSAPIDQGFSIQGSVVVSNTDDVAITISDIDDALSDGTPVTLACDSPLPVTLAPDEAIVCDYAQPVSGPIAVTNVATVTVQGVQQGFVVSAEIVFGEPTTVLSDTIVVNDSNGLDFTFGDTGSQSYPKEFECSAPTTTYPNTATIAGTTQTATASVTLNCYAVEVQKSVLPSYDQISEWEISKIAEPAVLDLTDGETGRVTYTVRVTRTGDYSDNFRVSGNITVSNPAPIPAQLAAVYDILRPSLVEPDVTCPEPSVVAPGGVYNCTYSSEELLFGTSRQNDAIAVLQNGTEALGSAPVNFDSVSGNPINNEISVSDSNGLDFTAGDSDSWQYTVDFDCSSITGYEDGVATETFDNVTTINETGQQAEASVEVTCRITPELPLINVIKSADPEEIVGSSGVVTFSLEVQNIGPVSVSLTSLTDDRFGDLTATANFSSTTCVLPPTMNPLDIYTCSFRKFITGDEAQPHTNVATATGIDIINQPVEDSDEATVTFDELPLIAVDKVADPVEIRGTSGVVTYTVTISNTGPVTVELTSLVDNRFGELTSPSVISTTTCAVPQSLDVGASYRCVFTAFIVGDEATPHINQVGALAYDKDLNSVIASDSATVTFDQLPLINVIKSADPEEIVGSSGVVAFSLAVQNVGPVAVSLTILNDDRFGDLTTTDNISSTTCALPQQVAPLGFYNCSFQAFVTGNATQPHIDTASVVGVDDNGNQAAAEDDASVSFVDIPEPQLPQIDVIKSANPSTLVGTGGVVDFTVLVQNSGPVPVTLTTLDDDKFGDLTSTANISSTTCSLSQQLGLNESYSCSFRAFVAGNEDQPHIDTVTAGGDDGNGNPVEDTDDEIVTFVPAPIPPLPELTVIKSANPTVIQGEGGVATFAVLVQNSGSVALSLTSLNDNHFGDLTSTTNISSTTCALPQALDPSELYECSFQAFVTGTENDPHVDIVTAGGVDDQNNPATDSDNATVVFDQLPELEVIKSAAPTAIQGIGGLVTFNVLVQNTGPVTLSLTTLNDDQFGDLSTTTNISSTTCLLPQTLDVAEIYSCSFNAFVTGDVGSPHTNNVTATGVDGSGHLATNSDDATVEFTDSPVIEVPEIAVIKSANPTTIVGPSGLVNFTVVVQNTGPVNVSLTSLNDDRFGDLTSTTNLVSTTCLLPQALNVGDHYTCSFQATVSGTETQPHTDIVTASGVDGSDNPVSASDNVTVEFQPEVIVQQAVIEVIKSASPAVVKGTGGVVTFTVSVQNIGTVALSLTTLEDDRFGDLTSTANFSSTTCILPQPLGLAEIYNCTFQAFVTGDDNTPHTNVLTATGEDDNQIPATSTDDSTVIFDQLPQIEVTKSVFPTSFESTQGVATYAVTVENTGPVTVSLEVLFDNRFDDVTKDILILNTTCVLPVVIDPGDIYRCVFRANVNGSAATPHSNTVTANAYDAQRNPATDFDDAVVRFTVPTNLDEGEQPFPRRSLYLPTIR